MPPRINAEKRPSAALADHARDVVENLGQVTADG